MLDFNFWKKYGLDDLNAIRSSVRVERTAVQIAVIDDKTFPPLEELRRHQFNITLFADIERLSILNDFDIVITDIRGVGKHLGSNLEGAHLIEEIVKQFPNKYLIAYSASRFDMTLNKYFNMCDERKKKDTDVHEWATTLDKAITDINDPIFQWEKTRQILIKQKFSSEYISKIEKAFAKSVVKRNSKYLQREVSSDKSLSERPIVKIAIESISSFTASFISELIKS